MSRPFIPAPNTASFELIFAYYGTVVENVYFVQKASPFSAADLIAVRNIFDAWDTGANKMPRSQNCSLTRIRSKALDSADSPIDEYTLPTPRAGGLSGYDMPGSVTVAVKFATGLAGRSQRGRKYLVGMNSSWITGNTITTSIAAQIVTCYNDLKSRLAAGTPSTYLVVASFRADKQWRTVASTHPVTGFVVSDLNADSQRRRLLGRGRT